MAETRYHELLGIPADVTDPDYYQLLLLDRAVSDGAKIEAAFKVQMTHLQHIENPKHKEFIEFLKGELKRARGVLADPPRRKEYDQELAKERDDELRKILSHMLLDGTLSSVAEVSVISEGKSLGMDGTSIQRIIDEELKRAGAKRVSVKANENGSQAVANQRAQDFVRELQDAKLQARISNSRAKMAEMQQRKAEEEAQLATDRAKHAQALARRAITREQMNQAQQERSFEHERGELEERAVTAETRARKIADESLRVASHLSESQKALEAEQAKVAAMAAKTVRWPRSAAAMAVALGLFAGVRLVKVLSPAALDSLAGAVAPIAEKLGSKGAAGAGVGGMTLLLVVTIALAGAKKPVYVIPLILAAAASALAALWV